MARTVEVVNDPAANRRTSPRHEMEVEVGMETDTNFYTGLTQDISTGGLFVATHQLRKIGDRMVIKFRLPDSPQVIAVEAEVRWLREAQGYGHQENHPGMGLKFINLSPQARMSIAGFLRKRESLFFDDE